METDRFATDMQLVTADFFFITNDCNALETASVFGFRNNQIQSLIEIRTQNPINNINQFRPTTEIAWFGYRSLKCMNRTA
jgi:predicted subunit of tRNA(5-methylaminomethyl-2-thiouridylate) methyltransferase